MKIASLGKKSPFNIRSNPDLESGEGMRSLTAPVNNVMTAQTMSFPYELACKGHSTEKAQDLMT